MHLLNGIQLPLRNVDEEKLDPRVRGGDEK